VNSLANFQHHIRHLILVSISLSFFALATLDTTFQHPLPKRKKKGIRYKEFFNNIHNLLYQYMYELNRSSRRKRGMASNPLFIIPDFFCVFPMNFAMATLGLKEMGKFLWEGREKICLVGCLSFVLLN
jgi:hypothetical protein